MVDSQSNPAVRSSQQPLPTFEHVLAFPRQTVDESWPEFVGRVQLWDRERTEQAQASGAYRAVPYVPGLDPVARGLFVSLAWHSFSEGLGQYAPIRLSERSLAALMGDTSSYAKGRAGVAMRQLIEAGAIEMLEEARGSRPRLVRVASACPSKERSSKESKGAKPQPQYKREDQGEKTPASSPPKRAAEASPPAEHAELAAAVTAQFDGRVTERTTLALVAELGADGVKQQLEWFPHRDVAGFRKGPAAAFVTLCRAREPKPSSMPVPAETRTREEIEADYQRRRAEAYARLDAEAAAEAEAEKQRRAREQEAEAAARRDASLSLRAVLSPEELSELEDKARAQITRLFGARFVDTMLESTMVSLHASAGEGMRA